MAHTSHQKPDHAALPHSWYLVCRSDELRRGGVKSVDLLGTPIVLFRSESGAVHALSAHCSHLGIHLGQGKVIGERIQCPLHHWEYDGEGLCRKIPASRAIPEGACQISYPVEERFGVVLLFNGEAATFPAPSFAAALPGAFRCVSGRGVPLRCSWHGVLANAFDIQHLESVHGRAIRDKPRFARPDPYRFQFHYVSRVTGSDLSDRIMRRVSRDRIEVNITCWGGSALTVESDLGRVQSALLLGVFPTEYGCEARPVFCVRGTSAVAALKARFAGWLFYSFLKRDIDILNGMRFRPKPLLPQDETLDAFVGYLEDQVPGGGRSRPTLTVVSGR